MVEELQSSKSVCLSCLTEECYKDLKTDYAFMGQCENYEKMLNYTFNITITQGHPPPLICEECIMKLRDAANLKKQIVQNQNKFIEFIKLQKIDKLKTLKMDSIKLSTVLTRKRKRCDVALSNDVKINKATSTSKTAKLESEIDKIRKLKSNTLKVLKYSNCIPFRWQRNQYKCFCCLATFKNFDEIKQHMPAHTFEEIKKEILKPKQVTHHKIEITNLTCLLCKKLLNNFMEFKKHLLDHEIVLEEDLLIPFKLQKEIKCAVCEEKFSVFHKLNVHMNDHFRNHICEHCGQGFISKINLKDHVERHNKKTYDCLKCNLKFSTEYQKDCHGNEIHKTVKKRVCPHCPERFSSHYARLLHLINKHEYKKPEYKCLYCERTFLRQYLVNCHIRKFHMKERKYECNICQLKFFGLFDRNQHVSTHSGEKKHICAQCGKCYARKRTLNDHMKTHRNVINAGIEISAQSEELSQEMN